MTKAVRFSKKLIFWHRFFYFDSNRFEKSILFRESPITNSHHTLFYSVAGHPSEFSGAERGLNGNSTLGAGTYTFSSSTFNRTTTQPFLKTHSHCDLYVLGNLFCFYSITTFSFSYTTFRSDSWLLSRVNVFL